jgi:hypothetical protein
MPLNDRVRRLPLTKLIALCFTIFTCVLILLDVMSVCQLTDRSTDLLKWLGSTIIVGYFGKSAYEHKVNTISERANSQP